MCHYGSIFAPKNFGAFFIQRTELYSLLTINPTFLQKEDGMRSLYLKKISLTAVFTALVAVATMVIVIPMPGVSGGYINFGDTIIFVGAYLLGPLGGFFAGAIGSAVADLVYAPKWVVVTFIVKGLEGLLCGLIASRLKKTNLSRMALILFAFIPSATVMVAGYLLGGFVLEGLSSGSFLTGFTVAVADIPFNLIQGSVSVTVAYLITLALSKIKYVDNFLTVKIPKGEIVQSETLENEQVGATEQLKTTQNEQNNVSDIDSIE